MSGFYCPQSPLGHVWEPRFPATEPKSEKCISCGTLRMGHCQPGSVATPPEMNGPLLELSLRFLEPHKARIADLERQLAAVRSFNITLNKANEAGEPRGLELDGKVWVVKPGDSAYEHWERWMKGNERRAG